jgi:hypothetical protein
MTVQVSETSSVPSPEGMIALCSVTRTGEPVGFLPRPRPLLEDVGRGGA